jgi:hypothetical protein
MSKYTENESNNTINSRLESNPIIGPPKKTKPNKVNAVVCMAEKSGFKSGSFLNFNGSLFKMNVQDQIRNPIKNS